VQQPDLPSPPLPSLDALPQDHRGPSRLPHGGWAAVAPGWQSSAALGRDGTLWTWGDNRLGMLGLDDGTHRLEPFQVSPGSEWLAVSAGLAHVLAIHDDGSQRS
jgi:alpha-tubulin suppressor-like RCC1 family protein